VANSRLGINVLVYYSTIIFSQVGVSPFMSQLLAAVMNTVFAIGTWFTPATIERFGRRPILLWSACACTILMTIFVAMIGQEHKTLATQWTAVATIVAFNLFFGWGWIGVPWLYVRPSICSYILPFSPSILGKTNLTS
jgi:MFS family permease